MAGLRSHIWEAVGLESKRSPVLLQCLNSSDLRCSLDSYEFSARSSRRTVCQSAYLSFPSGAWIWFHFELGTSKNETKAVVTVAVGGEENPRGFGNGSLTHHDFQDLVRVEGGGVSPIVQGRKLRLSRAPSHKGEMEAWMPRARAPQAHKEEEDLSLLLPRQGQNPNESLISLALTVLPADRPGFEVTMSGERVYRTVDKGKSLGFQHTGCESWLCPI